MTGTTAPDFIPIIDIARDRDDSAARIGRACATSGFFVVTGHGISGEVLARTTAAARELFAQPRATKLALLADPGDPLTRGIGREGSFSRPDTAPDPRRPDVLETFTVNRAGEPGAAATADPLLRLPNKWPAQPDFREAFEDCYRALENLASEMTRLCAKALRLPEDWFTDKFNDHLTNLTANYYPSQPVQPASGRFRLGAHRDRCALTLLYRDDSTGGLQVQDDNGSWHDVPTTPDSLVVNVGDVMTLWTNDHWRSAVHRVAKPDPNQPASDRCSLAFFYHPNHDTTISCVPSIKGQDNDLRHVPVTAGDYILQKSRRARARSSADGSRTSDARQTAGSLPISERR